MENSRSLNKELGFVMLSENVDEWGLQRNEKGVFGGNLSGNIKSGRY